MYVVCAPDTGGRRRSLKRDTTGSPRAARTNYPPPPLPRGHLPPPRRLPPPLTRPRRAAQNYLSPRSGSLVPRRQANACNAIADRAFCSSSSLQVPSASHPQVTAVSYLMTARTGPCIPGTPTSLWNPTLFISSTLISVCSTSLLLIKVSFNLAFSG